MDEFSTAASNDNGRIHGNELGEKLGRMVAICMIAS